MSDDDFESDVEFEAATLDTEAERDEWIEFLLDSNEPDDWAQVQTVQDVKGENMVARFRWADGREEVYDLVIRRSMEVVRPAGEEGSN